MLVLAKATPIVSKKYENLVCVAGITKDGEWRRIFPIPWDVFKGDSNVKFRKKQWIVYELTNDKSPDGRPESRKIKYGSIVPLYEESFKNIKKMLDSKLTTLEELQSKNRGDCSLGVVSPILDDMIWMNSISYSKTIQRAKGQMTLDGDSVLKLDIPDKKFQYIFRCSQFCPKEHKIMCEDWELGELYRKMKNKYGSEEACFKVKDKFLNRITSSGHVYFIMGTHNLWNTWMIISVIYPKKDDLKSLSCNSLHDYLNNLFF